MNSKPLAVIVAIIILIVLAVAVFSKKENDYPFEGTGEDRNGEQQDTNDDIDNEDADMSNLIKVDEPSKNEVVKSPLTVTGEARGTWFFEASFPVKLVDASGKVLAQGAAQAQSDWMTENFVPFKIELTFDPGTATEGTLILMKDNPSGLIENDGSISIPLKFKK